LAGIGIVCGLLAIGLHVAFSGHYVDDGTVAAYLFFLLALASHFPAEIGQDTRGAALGAVAFGLFLYGPALFAFDNLGDLDAGAWLGLCAGLIPFGLVLVRSAEREAGHSAPAGPSALDLRSPGLGPALLGLVLIVVGIWLPAGSHTGSSWHSSKTLAILMLLLVARSPARSDAVLLVAAITFGLVTYPFVRGAFEQFGFLGSGSWIEAFGGIGLLAGVLATRAAAARAAAPAAAPSAAAAA